MCNSEQAPVEGRWCAGGSFWNAHQMNARRGWCITETGLGLRKHLREGWTTAEIQMLFFFLILVGHCRGSPVSHVDIQTSRAIMGKWTLLHREMKVFAQSQSHVKGPRIQFAPESIFSLCLETFSLLDNYHLWWLKNVDRYNDPASHQNLFTKVNSVCLISFHFLLSILRELVFSQTLKLWMSFYDFVYIAVVFIF